MTLKKCIQFSLFIMVLLIMAQGCTAADYLTFHGDAQRTGYVADAGPLSENIRWSVSPGSIDSSPVVAGDRVFVATGPDMSDPGATLAVYCYDTDTGEELWTYETGSESGLTIADDLLIVGGMDGYLYALDTANGSLYWSVQADETPGFFGLTSSPLYYKGLLYILTPSDGGLHVYDPADGSEVWSVAFGVWDVGWTAATYFTAPAAADGVVYFPSNLSELYAYNTTTKVEIWNVSLDTTIASAPVIDTDSLFITTATTLYEVSLADGSILANRSVNAQLGTPALDIANDHLYVGTGSGMVCLDTNDITAAPVWERATAKMTVSPVVAGDYVYGATNEEQSSLYAFSAADGTDAWSYTLPAPEGNNWASFWGSSPAVADGTLYIGAEYTNTLFAFGANVTPIEPVVIFDDSVTVVEGETFTFVPSNNASASYTVNRTTDLGALDTAAMAGGFTFNASDAWYADYSSFLIEDIAGIVNDDWRVENGHSWAIYLNGAPTASGLGANDLADGDALTFYFCPSDPVTYAPIIDEATYVVRIDVTVDGGITPEYIFDGNVTVVEGETFTFVPSNNASASYTVNRTTDLGALDTAATTGGFTFNASDAWYADYSSFLIEDIAGIANDDWQTENAHSWSIYLNGAATASGLGANALSDGDTLIFYFCPTDSETYVPIINEATYIVEVDVTVDGGITPEYIFDGGVTVVQGETFSFVPSNNASVSYTVNCTTDLGALDTAATAGGFTFNASDAWYADYGSFLIEDIGGIANDDWQTENAHSWAIYLNDAPTMAGLGANNLADGDTLTFYFCPSDPETFEYLIDEATYIVEIDVKVSPVAVSDVTVTDAARGGMAQAQVTVKALDAGWYVVVVSGVNTGGDSLAGIATVHLDAGSPMDIPALIAVPQHTQTGTYTLYAGVYTLDDFPDNLLNHSEGVECVIS
ncbi:outer membrane protein assembly factor BamB family protein [Methanogenium cariaci]